MGTWSYESSSSIYLQLIEEVDFYLILLYRRNRVRTLPLYLIDVIGLFTPIKKAIGLRLLPLRALSYYSTRGKKEPFKGRMKRKLKERNEGKKLF